MPATPPLDRHPVRGHAYPSSSTDRQHYGRMPFGLGAIGAPHPAGLRSRLRPAPTPRRRAGTRIRIAALALALAGCTAQAGGGPCDPPRKAGALPAEVDESSGVAASRRHTGVLWTINDSGGEPALFAVDSAGRILGRTRVTGARNVDWEDLALGPCPDGDCLYIADTGDNRLRRDHVVVYRIPEPRPGDAATPPAEAYRIRYPNGPRDVEAIFVLPGGDLFLVSKGRGHPIAVYGYPPPLRPDSTVEVEEVARLSDAAVGLAYQVTGAVASDDGRWVAIRTYAAIRFHRIEPDGRLDPRPLAEVDLQPLAEPQGEAIGVRPDGTLVLTSEAGPAGIPGFISFLDCRVP
jgi:hypothetical protein